MKSTGVHGEYVAGVRFRAWQPPSALHPTIGIHAPLVFDIIDTWNGRSVGGCTYHVSHPGGRNSESFPVNAYYPYTLYVGFASVVRNPEENPPLAPPFAQGGVLGSIAALRASLTLTPLC